MKDLHVTAAIIERDGKTLICQRHHTAKMPLKWEFPGGKIEPGETGEACLRRELREELAIEAEIGALVTDFVYQYPDMERRVHLYFYRVDAFEGEIRNNVFERIEWVDREELPSYDFLEADVEMVERMSVGEL